MLTGDVGIETAQQTSLQLLKHLMVNRVNRVNFGQFKVLAWTGSQMSALPCSANWTLCRAYQGRKLVFHGFAESMNVLRDSLEFEQPESRTFSNLLIQNQTQHVSCTFERQERERCIRMTIFVLEYALRFAMAGAPTCSLSHLRHIDVSIFNLMKTWWRLDTVMNREWSTTM